MSDPGCAGDEIEHYRQTLKALMTERDRLRTVVRKLWGAWNDATLDDYENADHGLDRDELRLLDDVVRDNPLQAIARRDGARALLDERDRLRAVVEAVRRIRERTADELFSLADDEADELSDALDQALDALDAKEGT